MTLAGKLAGLEPEINRERDRKLEEARQRRQQIRQQQVGQLMTTSQKEPKLCGG